ncbi:MAG: FKBP-type peptidyl-prolyl cis-trans isomerase [Colwellia sp.]|nr:FKBP-type peptidyl-prolyl cis-trans isomerase [Colwellia sp.]
MLIRTGFVSLVCTLMFGCNSTSNSGSLYSAEEINAHWFTINLERDGVLVTDSGLQYKVLERSTGCKPDPDYKVTVHYKMLLAKTKKVIDSSYQRGKSSKMQLSKVVKGWAEGIPMMRVGESWELYIPPHLAYGSKGLPGSVAPNSVLISQITLIDARCQD